MSGKRQKTVNRLCIILFILLAAALSVLEAYSRAGYLSNTAVTIDRRIAEDGVIIDLRDDEGDIVWLRKISPDGELLAHLKLSRIDKASDEYRNWRILDISGNTVWLWETVYNIYEFSLIRESIVRCDISSKARDTLYTQLKGESGIPGLYSPGLRDGCAYIGERSIGGGIEVFKVRLDGDAEREYYGRLPESLISKIYIPRSGEIIGVSFNSDIKLYSTHGEEIRSLYDRSVCGAIASFSIGSGGEMFVYAVDGDNTALLKIGPDGKEPTRLALPEDLGLISVTAITDDVWVGHDAAFTLVHSGNQRIERLGINLALTPDADNFILYLAGILLALAAVLLLRYLLLLRRLPLMIKQILCAIPVFAAGLYIISGYLIDEIDGGSMSSLRHELIWRTEEKILRYDFSALESVNWESPLDDQNYLSLISALGFLSASDLNTVFDANINEWHSESSYINYWLFAVDGQNVKTAYCGNVSIGLPYEYAQIKDLSAPLAKAFTQDAPVFSTAYDDIGGKWYMLRQPITNRQGEIVALLDVSMPYVQIQHYLAEVELGLLLWVAALMLVVMISCIAVSLHAIKRMVRLKKAALALCEGDYSYRLKVTGRDEVTDITRAFNEMAEKVEMSVKAISETSKSYSRFVPRELLSILGRQTVLDVLPGDSAEIFCTLLFLSTSEFEHNLGDNLFERLNLYYKAVMPSIARAGGVIERYGEDEMAAIFMEAPSSAVKAAYLLFDELDSSGAFNNGGLECTAVIGMRKIRLGVIGGGVRINATIVSRFIRQSRMLGEMGQRLGCRIILADDAYAQSEIPEGVFGRYIGNAVMDGSACPLYEVFHGETERERIKSQSVFSEALGLYQAARFHEARNLFIEVIKISPRDFVAREYLLLSDGLMQSPSEPEPLLIM